MIKEIFEIEPRQKSSAIIFTALCFISFLQLYLFKKNLFDENAYIVIGITLSLNVCWSAIHIIPAAILIVSEANRRDGDIQYANMLFAAGLIILIWMIFITYRGYHYKMTISEFIPFAFFWTVVFYAVCFVFSFIRFLRSIPK